MIIHHHSHETIRYVQPRSSLRSAALANLDNKSSTESCTRMSSSTDATIKAPCRSCSIVDLRACLLRSWLVHWSVILQTLNSLLIINKTISYHTGLNVCYFTPTSLPFSPDENPLVGWIGPCLMNLFRSASGRSHASQSADSTQLH